MHYSLLTEYRSLYRLEEKDKQADHVMVPYVSTVKVIGSYNNNYRLAQQIAECLAVFSEVNLYEGEQYLRSLPDMIASFQRYAYTE